VALQTSCLDSRFRCSLAGHFNVGNRTMRVALSAHQRPGCSVNGLKGPFDVTTVNVGIGAAQVTLQWGSSGGTWIFSATIGPGLGIDVSQYQTNTKIVGP
jgi:hypothetical protein